MESAKGEMRKMFSPVVYILDEFKIVCVPGRELVRETGIEEESFQENTSPRNRDKRALYWTAFKSSLGLI